MMHLHQLIVDLYISHKKPCSNRNWKCDFYLPSQFDKPELWIECDGLEKRRETLIGALERFREKLKYYKDNNLNLLIIKKKDNVLNQLDNYYKDNYGTSS